MRRVFLLTVIFVFSFLSSCNLEFDGDLQQSLLQVTTTTYTVYSANPGSSDGYQEHKLNLKIGEKLSTDVFPSVSRPGFTFVGWRYYKNPRTGSTSIPSNFNVDSDSCIKDFTPSPQPACIVAEWIKQLYVSSSGNDTTGDGSYDYPLASLSGAAAFMKNNNFECQCSIIVMDEVSGTDFSDSNFPCTKLMITGDNSSAAIKGSGGSSVGLFKSIPVVMYNLTVKGGSGTDVGGKTYGGGILVGNNINAVLRSVKIGGNSVTGSGGGIAIDNGSVVTMEECSVISNTATNYIGGGIVVFNGATCYFNGNGLISGNSSGYSGGGVGVDRALDSDGNPVQGSGVFVMNGGTITNNEAPAGGGVSNAGTFVMNGGAIYTNTSTSSEGSGVYAQFGTFSMGGTSFVSTDNDIYLCQTAVIGVSSSLSVSSTPVAKVKPEVYLVNKQVLTGGGVSARYGDFELIQPTGDPNAWYINSSGCLKTETGYAGVEAVFAVDNSDIEVTYSVSGNIVTFTAPTGYSYTWKVDGTTQSETGNVLTVDTEGFIPGKYDVVLSALKDGTYYSYFAQIKK